MLDVIMKADPSTSLGMTVKNRQFFLAFYDMAGHNFIGRSGTNNIDTTEDRRRRTEVGKQSKNETTDYTD
jgi:hypothetical protein